MGKRLSISEVAGRTDTTPYTLRYYERIGLLVDVARAPSGHRAYSEEDVAWVDFLRCLRAAGMPIADMRRYVEAARAGDPDHEVLLEILREHRGSVRDRLAELRDHLDLVERKIAFYGGESDDCG